MHRKRQCIRREDHCVTRLDNPVSLVTDDAFDGKHVVNLRQEPLKRLWGLFPIDDNLNVTIPELFRFVFLQELLDAGKIIDIIIHNFDERLNTTFDELKFFRLPDHMKPLGVCVVRPCKLIRGAEIMDVALTRLVVIVPRINRVKPVKALGIDVSFDTHLSDVVFEPGKLKMRKNRLCRGVVKVMQTLLMILAVDPWQHQDLAENG